MEKKGKIVLGIGSVIVLLFGIWTTLVQLVDVQPLGQNGTEIGFATFNCRFHEMTGVHMQIYDYTDLLSVIPFLVCGAFGLLGVVQLIKRRSLLKVDPDILVLGVYYIVVISSYAVYELIPVNYRPILIEGAMEVSYPSSTTLLVLAVMPTLAEQLNRRLKNKALRIIITILTALFTGFMLIGRMISGVHWFSDIVGGVLLSVGLFLLYKGFVLVLSEFPVTKKV